MYYKTFVDDSGSKDYINPFHHTFADHPIKYEGNEEYWRNNYFVLAGLRIRNEDIGSVDQAVTQLKLEYFGTENVEIKSGWLRNPFQRSKHYTRIFGVSENKLLEFGNRIHELLLENKDTMKIVSTVFDKCYFNPEKPNNDPLVRSVQVLLERVHRAGGNNTVIFDQMEGTLNIVGKNKVVHGVYSNNQDVKQIYIDKYTKIDSIKFSNSAQVNMLQLADICAYNIFRQFVLYGRAWQGTEHRADGKLVLPCYDYFSKICPCFYSYEPYYSFGPSKTVRGGGLVVIPDKKKVDWNLLG